MTASATLMVHLTGRCNLECRHCYMEGSPRRRERLATPWVVESIRAAPGLGIGSLFLTGGEPLLHPDFVEVAEAAGAAEGLATTICTNATLLRLPDAERFARLGFQVHVSIDGTPQFHDEFRSRSGAFRDAARGVRLLVENGVPVTIVTTVSQANIAQFPDVAQWVINSGAARLLVQPLLNLGRGGLISDQRLTTEQLNMLIMQTSDIANSANIDPEAFKASIIGASKRFLAAHPCAAYVCNGGGCHRGVSAEIKKVVVRENGTILPEATNLHPRYAIGTVDDGPLAHQLPRYFAEGYEAFDALCRATYDEHIAGWPDAIVPWDELLAAQSKQSPALSASHSAPTGCGVEALADRLAELVVQ